MSKLSLVYKKKLNIFLPRFQKTNKYSRSNGKKFINNSNKYGGLNGKSWRYKMWKYWM